MKNLFIILISAVVAVSLASCGKNENSENIGASQAPDSSYSNEVNTAFDSGDGSEMKTDGERNDSELSDTAKTEDETDGETKNDSGDNEDSVTLSNENTYTGKSTDKADSGNSSEASRPASSGSSTGKPATTTKSVSTKPASETTTKAPTTTGSGASTTTAPHVTSGGDLPQDNKPAAPAPSYPLKGTIKTDPNADYNTPQVNFSRICEGAGPLTSHQIYVGSHDFMFLGETVADYTGTNLCNDAKLKKLASIMNDRDAWAKENGIKLYFMICPNKATVYSDNVPSSLTGASYTRLDQVTDYLTANSTVEIIDLRSPLKSARSAYGDSLYYKYDTHWTQDAGFVAYTELMKHVNSDFKNAVYYPKSAFNINTYETYMKDMPYYLGYYDRFTDYGTVYSLKEGPAASLITKKSDGNWGQFAFCYQWPDGYRDNLKYFKYRSKNTGAPSVYVYRDSFSIALVPFIKESFYESTFDWDRNFSKSEILASGADVVIIQVVEKSIGEIIQSRTFID